MEAPCRHVPRAHEAVQELQQTLNSMEALATPGSWMTACPVKASILSAMRTTRHAKPEEKMWA